MQKLKEWAKEIIAGIILLVIAIVAFPVALVILLYVVGAILAGCLVVAVVYGFLWLLSK